MNYHVKNEPYTGKELDDLLNSKYKHLSLAKGQIFYSIGTVSETSSKFLISALEVCSIVLFIPAFILDIVVLSTSSCCCAEPIFIKMVADLGNAVHTSSSFQYAENKMSLSEADEIYQPIEVAHFINCFYQSTLDCCGTCIDKLFNHEYLNSGEALVGGIVVIDQ